jgi:hypothetical protein
MQLSFSRKTSTILVLACIALSCEALSTFGPTNSTEIGCEKIQLHRWFYGEDKTCFINGLTTIASLDTMIAMKEDRTITGLWPQNNKRVKFLPLEIYKSFPNLNVIDASDCGIYAITKKNFEKLTKLTGLFLDRNQITTVRSNTFEDLTSLKRLSFSESNNPIKTIQIHNEMISQRKIRSSI